MDIVCFLRLWTGIVRDRPVPIPGSGMQLTNIAHVRDLSSMLVLAVEKPEAARGNIFNCVSDRAVTLDGMAKLCAQAAGRPVIIVHYDPKASGVDAKKAFPFRNMVTIISETKCLKLLEPSLPDIKEEMIIGKVIIFCGV